MNNLNKYKHGNFSWDTFNNAAVQNTYSTREVFSTCYSILSCSTVVNDQGDRIKFSHDDVGGLLKQWVGGNLEG